MSTEALSPLETEWRLPSPRKTGMILTIMTESALFTIFVVAYVFYLGKSLNGPYPHEVLEFPWLGSFLLFGSSGTIYLAERGLKRDSRKDFNLWWGITIAMGFGFLLYTATEWLHLINVDHLYISTNLFGSCFYSLVGLHASHVVVGLFLLGVILIASLTGRIRDRHHEHIEIISWYWHFVDCVWLVVVIVVYIIGINT